MVLMDHGPLLCLELEPRTYKHFVDSLLARNRYTTFHYKQTGVIPISQYVNKEDSMKLIILLPGKCRDCTR